MGDIRRHIVPEIGDRLLNELRPEDVNRLLDACEAKGLAPGSVKKVRDVLNAALNRAMKWGVVDRNAVKLSDARPVPRYEGVWLTPDEVRKFVDAVAGRQWEMLYLMAVGTGMRMGELRGLAWTDVDLKQRTVRVRQQLTGVSTNPLSDVKTKAGRRTIVLPPHLATALAAHKKRQHEARMAAIAEGNPWLNDADLCFTAAAGLPVPARTLDKDFHAILEAAGLPRIRFHDLRHSCASYLLQAGVNVKVVQEMLGHKHIATTMDTYSHVIPRMRTEAADALNDVFASR